MWGMIAGAAIGLLSKMGEKKQQSQAIAQQNEQIRKQKLQAIRQSNYQDAALQLQARSTFEQARKELENQSMSAIKASATVKTAMAESNLEGRSMERVQRDVDNAYYRTKGMITENYERDYHNIWVQREQGRNQLIAQLENTSYVQDNSGSGILGMVGGAVQGATVGNNLWGTLKNDPNLQSNKAK